MGLIVGTPSPTPRLHVLIDADTLLYRIGFLSLPGPGDYVLAVLKLFEKTMNESVEAAKAAGLNTSTVVHHLFFTSRGVPYRASFDSEAVYKEHRKKAAKPKYVSEMQQAIEIAYKNNIRILPSGDGEADDLIAMFAYDIRQCKRDTYIVCGCDKDLKQIPGIHFNYITGKVYAITKEEANRWFFQQLLMGDVADNVPGLKGIGPKKSNYILGTATGVENLWDLTLSAYNTHYAAQGLTEDEIADIIYERANKLWLKKTLDDVWTPPVSLEG